MRPIFTPTFRRFLRSAVLLGATAYLLDFGYEVWRLSQAGVSMAVWYPDWGITHGEPYVILALAVFTGFDAILSYWEVHFRLSHAGGGETRK